MSGTPTQAHDRPLLGASLMIAAMFMLPVGEAATKYLSADQDMLGLSWLRFTIGALVTLPLAIAVLQRDPVTFDRQVLFEQTLRAALVVAAITFFVGAISHISLANAIGAYFVGPVVAAILAAVLLGETISPRRAAILAIGFIGSMVIIQPSPSMNIGFVFALAAGCCYGLFLVATRWAARSVNPIVAVAFQSGFGAVVLAPFAVAGLQPVPASHWWILALMGTGSVVANFLTICAMRFSSATTLAPLVYFELIAAILLGYAVFGDIPSTVSWIGIGIILVSGALQIGNRSR